MDCYSVGVRPQSESGRNMAVVNFNLPFTCLDWHTSLASVVRSTPSDLSTLPDYRWGCCLEQYLIHVVVPFSTAADTGYYACRSWAAGRKYEAITPSCYTRLVVGNPESRRA